MEEERYKQETYKNKLLVKTSLLGFFIFIFLIQTTSAFISINIFLDEKGEAIFLGETDENLTEFLPAGINLENGEITGFTSALTNKIGEFWEFSYSQQGAEMNLILPEGALIKDLSNGEISIQEDRISVFFSNQVLVKYTIEKSQIQERKPINIPILIILIAILIILMVYIINYSKREKKKEEQKENQIKLKKKREKKEKLEIIKQVLSEREKLILGKLEETGKIKSSYLRKMTEIPKASFSRYIQELEKKDIIKRTGEGKNKFVELVKK